MLAVFREFGGQNLQRDAAMKLCVFGQIHFTHPAFANLRADFVTAEFCAGTKSHYYSCHPAAVVKVFNDGLGSEFPPRCPEQLNQL